MKKIAIQHIPDSNYAYAISEDKFVIRLRVARNDDISCLLYTSPSPRD